MVGRPPGDRSIDPGELLRSALEKIVYFECRVAQLESELAAARQVAERARADAALARTRETEASQALLAEREASAAQSLRQADLSERVRLLEAERERLMAGLVERARVGGAPLAEGAAAPEDGQADLASFIAELRATIVAQSAELAALRDGRAGAATPAAGPRGAADHAPVDALAAAFAAGGRTGLGARDVAQLGAVLATNADKVLYERAMRDLEAGAVPARLTAIRHLEALGARAAAPLLAAALGGEPDAGVKVALLRALARFQEPFAAPLCARELEEPRAEVRAAALEALAVVAEAEAEPHLLRGLDDRSPIVRRRAAVLLNAFRGERAEEALVAALRDPDRGVARAAAVALSGRPGERVRRALARHEIAQRLAQGAAPAAAAPARAPDAAPLRAAAAEPPSAAALRVAARLAGAEVAPVGAPGSPPARPPARPPVPAPAEGGPPVAAPRPRAAVAVLEAAQAAPAPAAAGDSPFDALLAAIELEIRGALRGRSAEELAAATGAPAARVEAALEALRARGTLTLRGTRWWFA